jgi:hypothetical protein
MSSTRVRFAAAFLVSLAAFAGTAGARDWIATGWVKIPARAYPSAAAPLAGTVDGGSYLELTGECTRDLDLSQISYMSGWHQRALVSTRWCELSGPTHGWIFGGFMKPF